MTLGVTIVHEVSGITVTGVAGPIFPWADVQPETRQTETIILLHKTNDTGVRSNLINPQKSYSNLPGSLAGGLLQAFVRGRVENTGSIMWPGYMKKTSILAFHGPFYGFLSLLITFRR